MNWAWVTSLDQLWRSPTFPMWLTLGASGFFGIIVLITLLRAEKSVANGALTVITLLAICGLTHKQSYFDLFVVGSLTAFVASLLVLGLYLTVGVF